MDWGRRKVGGAYGFLWAFDSLYMANMRGFYRIRDILVAICEPSASISEQYVASLVKLKDDDTLNGRLIFRNDQKVGVATSPFDMNQVTKAPADQVQDIAHSQVYLMPTETISGLNRDELMDLVAFLLSGGDSQHKVFTK